MSIPRTTTRLLLPAATAGVLALAACSSSGGGSSGSAGAAGGATHPASGTGGGTATAALKVRSTSVGKVLTDAQGHTLYVSDQEKGKVVCASASCTAIWMPVTVAGSTAPAAPSGVTVGMITRPDGQHQVTLNGQPLYTFSFDHAAGATGGNGQHDSFDGTSFSWHAAVTSGARPSAPASSPSSSSGYHY